MTPRKELTPAALKGRRPAVRVYEEGGRVKVQWSEAGLRTYRTYGATAPGRSEARRFAVGVYDRLTAPRVVSRLTTRHLWVRYTESAFATLRPRTQQLYASRWRRWELFIGATTIAEDVPTEAVARFASELRKRHPVTQVMGFIRVVKIVYNWGDQLEVLQRNRIGRYRFKRGKDEQVNDPPEYRTPDWEAILRALGGGQEGRQWKAWAAVMLAGSQGERINAALHLQWADVDWAGGRICWRAATNKQGRERWQPMTYEAYAALLTARWWADHRATDPHVARSRRIAPGAFVLPGAGAHTDRPYTYQAAHQQLREAETAARVPHLKWRGFHGFRKMVAGNVAADTRDPWLALQWIGDSDPKRAKEYVKLRDDRMQEIAENRHD